MKYLITGISGFVGGHYVEHLLRKDADIRISGADMHCPEFDFLDDAGRRRVGFYQGSLLDKNWVRDLLEKVRPDYIVNLAGHSSVAFSWKNPIDCFVNNINIFFNIVEGVRKTQVNTKILSVGSAEEYGVIKKKTGTIKEDFPLNPANPYAIAQVAQGYFSKIYRDAYAVPIIRTRSFNHIGPRQKDTFVVSSFAKQVAEVKRKERGKIVCGNLDIARDFMDVRDVVRAYDLLLKKGKIGHVYNVCSGEKHKLSEILEILRKKAGLRPIPIKRDPALIRPVDNISIAGSCEKLCKDTGFKREYTLSQALADILAYWETRLRTPA